MPNELQFAVSVAAHLDVEGERVSVHSPTFYLHPDVQGITNEDHAKSIVTGWLARIAAYNPSPIEFDVAVAATTVDTPDPQANALLRQVKTNAPTATLVVNEPFDLPAGYLLVCEQDGYERGFACGIAPDGRVSS